MSGVCLVPALGHTTAECVVRFGSDSWQAIFLAYTHPCLLASSQPEGAERIAVTAAVPNEPMAARVEPPCCWWSGLPRNAGRHTTGVLSWWRRPPPYDPETEPDHPDPEDEMRDVVGSIHGHEVGRRFLADDEPIQEQREVDRATKHQVIAGLRCGAP
jgi:hypothetical protein